MYIIHVLPVQVEDLGGSKSILERNSRTPQRSWGPSPVLSNKLTSWYLMTILNELNRSKDYLQQKPLHRMNSRICFTTKDGLCNQFATPCSAEGKLFAPPWEAHHYLVLDLNAGIEAVPVPWSFCLGTFCSFKCLGKQITQKTRNMLAILG